MVFLIMPKRDTEASRPDRFSSLGKIMWCSLKAVFRFIEILIQSLNAF